MKRGVLRGVVVASLAAAVLWGSARAAPEDVEVGDIRAVLSKTGARLRGSPSALARATDTLPLATRVRVAEVRGAWIRVTTVAGGEGAAAGWLPTGQTVEPFALTQSGRGGAIAVRDGQPSGTDISAAGRQFDADTERSYLQTNPDLRAFFPRVDEIEASAPDPEAVRAFILEGRLGRREGGE